MDDPAVVLYECATCHFKDDVADRDDVPTCVMSGENMVPVRYVPVSVLNEALDLAAEGISYTPQYFVEKWNLDKDYERLRAIADGSAFRNKHANREDA